MPLLLDTYNILHVVGILPPELAGLDAPGLAQLLHEQSRWRHEECRLICDGTPKGPMAQSTGSVRIEFAGPGVTADEVIARHVEASSSPRRITVVSNDREVQREARRRRWKVMDAESFLSQLVQDVQQGQGQGHHASLPTASTDEWIDQFELEDRLNLQGAPDLPEKPSSPAEPSSTPEETTPSPPNDTAQPSTPQSLDPESLEDLDMDDLIDEEGHWKDPNS